MNKVDELTNKLEEIKRRKAGVENIAEWIGIIIFLIWVVVVISICCVAFHFIHKYW